MKIGPIPDRAEPSFARSNSVTRSSPAQSRRPRRALGHSERATQFPHPSPFLWSAPPPLSLPRCKLHSSGAAPTGTADAAFPHHSRHVSPGFSPNDMSRALPSQEWTRKRGRRGAWFPL
ncbi:hypothetical protein VPH35_075412 [Triticum aestivum]